ncbi:DUF799 domain-containing protein [Laribacter hongkongensis]|uniref:DUF799 domain-containing protein n=1 Tax=Laribacter hongkongensis TaxID=168471 RepID=UPI001EFC851E|nr:DUF799 domain-containing protein [Laribacter hongkongensis]MCG9076273.1 DUF799 domain-containing protein [Laribacter hongkongensis]
MKNKIQLGLIVVLSLLMAACATKPVNYDYTAYKANKPKSILVLPPVNQSPDVNAGISMLSLATRPLAEAGYYVMPVALVSETFKQNGVTVADDAQNIPFSKLHDIFGADAALYVSIKKYGTSYRIIDSVVEVSADAKLVDLRSGTTLWQGSAQASSAENQNNSGGGLIGMLVNAAINQIVHNLADHSHDIAAITSNRLLSYGHPGGLLYGPYNPKYGTD